MSTSIDLHCHLERDEDIRILTDLIADDLDILAITNHANKRDVMLAQNERVQQLASQRPDVLFLSGMEWNAIGSHVNIVFPSTTIDETYLVEFLDRFEPCESIDAFRNGIAFLSDYPSEAQPLICINHPAFPSEDTPYLLADTLAELQPNIILAVDGFHGHQAWAQKFPDPFNYPGSKENGVIDRFFQRDVRCALVAPSDFHPNKHEKKPDYPPGAYQRVLLQSGKSISSAFKELKNGNTLIIQNRVIDSLDFSCEWTADGCGLSINIQSPHPIEKLEVLVGLADKKMQRIPVHSDEINSIKHIVSDRDIRYVRIRGKSDRPDINDPTLIRPCGFAASPIFNPIMKVTP